MSETKIKNDEESNQNKCWWVTAIFKNGFNPIGQAVKFIIRKVRRMWKFIKKGASAGTRGAMGVMGWLCRRLLREDARRQNAQEIEPKDLEIDCISAIENDTSRAAQRRIIGMAKNLSYHIDNHDKVIMDIGLEDGKMDICVDNDGNIRLHTGLPGVRSAVFEEVSKIFKANPTRFVFFGASGSGKSALINRLRGIDQNQLSAEDRAYEDTGVGTGAAGAAAKRLTLHNFGGLEIIDTPGYIPGSEPAKDYIGKMFNDVNVNPKRLDYFDLPVMVLDAKSLNDGEKFNKEDELIIRSLLDNRFSRITVVLNKVELMQDDTIEEKEELSRQAFFQKLEKAGISQYRKCFNVVCTSSETIKSSHNIEALKNEMALNAIAVRSKRFDSYVKALVSTFIKRRKNALLIADNNICYDYGNI